LSVKTRNENRNLISENVGQGRLQGNDGDPD